ncbi:MAG TPA: potassium/proton antiporter [Myxococcaceae bacterium]|nr:potassium/proton antiporter [Myxococcaceae bacterium]
MPLSEPADTAALLATLGALLAFSVLVSRAAGRVGVPLALLFIGVGMVAGSEGLGGIDFEDYQLTYRLGTAALVLILFDGGLNTPLAFIREGLKPATLLATVGVVGTAVVVAVAARLLGFDWSHALLLGAIVSSTDAATVFAVLRGSGIHLKRRVGVTLELESGLNDPVAVLLTTALTTALLRGEGLTWRLPLEALREIVVGGALGAAIGWGGGWLLRRVRLPAGGLYPVLTLALALLAFGVPTLFHGSGFLAVYLAAALIGNEALRYKSGLLRVHDALAWISQVGMFLVLGLLVYPSQLLGVAWTGLGLGCVLAFVARPLVVFLCLLPFRFSPREALYVGWVGLRGAVPVVLATYPVLAGAAGAHELFNVVFFVVVLNAFVPGATVAWVTRRLGLASDTPPPPPAVLEITSTQLLRGELVSFFVRSASAAAGATLAELPFPESVVANLIVRGNELVAPRGGTRLLAGDHVYVLCKTDDLPLLQLMFGQPEAD